MIKRVLGLLVTLSVLAACDPSRPASPETASEPKQSGVSISGYGRVGVSTNL
ncbi:hypothetical protein SAMN05444358_103150 [Ruegeria halocynthiae]|uniref:Argininosuccinate lyase n=1 Tax=Ruegeria halocynthiae TaxID=985054 RepID=A0A1H2ZC42_9RHOB|nr:hypothetical protein [Ruegeria halocynthiae]SDX14404.1 hypothetical protein SAMN05444358_103150 [Ruegeria halocynthiae]